MTGSIICGVDDSDSAKGAARVARGLSARLGQRLVFVRVAEDGSTDEKISAIAARLHRLADSATDVDCGAHWLVDVGHPADRLVAAAKEEAATLIVVGSTGPRSSLLGSVSRRRPTGALSGRRRRARRRSAPCQRPRRATRHRPERVRRTRRSRR